MGGGYLASEQDAEQQTFFSQPQLPQQVIDEALCIGFNDRNSRLIICAHYMKDKPLEENAAFLQKSYGTNGVGLLIQDREYAIWYDPEGIRIATAYALRAPGQKGIQFRAWGSLLGQLLLRSIDRAQLVYESMQLRGFAGSFPPGQKKHGGWLFLAVTVFYCAVFRAVPVFELAGRLL